MEDRSADKIPMHAPEWLMEGLIPRAGLTLIAGKEKVGKSQFVARLAADVTRGVLLNGPANVILTSEDDLSAVAVPRLSLAGADLSRVYPERQWHFPRDRELLEEVIVQRGIRLVVLDPLRACVEGVGTSREEENLIPLREMGHRLNVAIIAVHHFIKSLRGKEIREAIGGRGGIQTVPRAILIFGKEPKQTDDAPERCVLAPFATNYGEIGPSLMYERVSHPHPVSSQYTVAILQESGESELSADQVFSATAPATDEKRGDKRQTAKNLIRHLLASGPQTASELEHNVMAGGITQRTYLRARQELREDGTIESYKADGEWHWRIAVPDRPPKDWT